MSMDEIAQMHQRRESSRQTQQLKGGLHWIDAAEVGMRAVPALRRVVRDRPHSQQNNTSSSFPRDNNQESATQREAKYNLLMAMSSVITSRKRKKPKLQHGEHQTRPRQWQEPPGLHYNKYKVYEKLQQEIKRIGGQHVGTSSDLTDLDMKVLL